MKSLSLAAITILLVSGLVLTKTATATEVDFNNSGGTLSGTNAGLSLSGSTLIAVNGLNGGGLITGNNLGSVSFTTGALTSGSLSGGGTFAGGGTFSITGNGSNGLPNGVLFSGTFTAPVVWTKVDGVYSLSGPVVGALTGGITITGGSGTVQLTVNTAQFTGSTPISGGSTHISFSRVSVPEPSYLELLGTGGLMLGMMMIMIPRKLLVR